MNTEWRTSFLALVLVCTSTRAWAETTVTNSGLNAAIQAIQQASDPSAAVAAYASGFADDRNNPKLYEAYVTRMVDLGLPKGDRAFSEHLPSRVMLWLSGVDPTFRAVRSQPHPVLAVRPLIVWHSTALRPRETRAAAGGWGAASAVRFRRAHRVIN